MRPSTGARKSHTTPRRKLSSRPKTSSFLNFFLVLIALFVISVTAYKLTIVATSEHNSIAKLELSLADVTIEEIDAGDKTIKYPGNTLILSQDGQSTTFENVEIKGRGNSTWAQAKKPYQIKFSENTSLFDYGKARKWVLLANFSDHSYLRTATAFKLEQLLNEPFSLNGSFVELYIDNTYHGLYYLAEKVEIGKSRVNLKEPSGLIMELDNLYGQSNECFYTDSDTCYTIHDSVNEDYNEQSAQSFISDINAFEAAIANKDYASISKVIDIDSFAKYFLLNEFSINPDAYSTSFFLYEDGENDKIHAGPGWDFDLSLGNDWGVESFHAPNRTMTLKDFLDNEDKSHHDASISTIIYDLMAFPEFETRVCKIYQENLSGHQDELIDYIQSQDNYIHDAAKKDIERWKLKIDFDDEVDYLIDWVAKRFDHFEKTYGNNNLTETTPVSNITDTTNSNTSTNAPTQTHIDLDF